MQLTHIDITDLKVSPLNMRYGEEPDISDILPSVRKRGVLLPLLVRPNGSGYEIVAGARRFAAAQAVAEEAGEIDPLPCGILDEDDDAAALEASMLENHARLDPHEMTQYEHFARLVKAGQDVADIAATFSLTERQVEQRLALGNLLPKIREAYRADKVSVPTIRHLTMATKTQQKAWLKLFDDPATHEPCGANLKRWLLDGDDISTGGALFPLEEYTARKGQDGKKGRVITDLFGDGGYFADRDLFWECQNEAIAAARDALLANGWAEVEILERGQRFYQHEHSETSKAKGGRVYVTVAHNGAVDFHKGYLTTKEAARKRRAEAAAARGDDAPVEKPERVEISQRMQDYLEGCRHTAVRAELLQHPGLALRLLVAHVIEGSHLWTVSPEHLLCGNDTFETERAEIIALLGLPERGCVVHEGRDDKEVVLLTAKLLQMPDDEVLRVLTFVMSETLACGSGVVEAVGNYLGVDMANHWEPDDEFLDLIRDKRVLTAMMREIAGKRTADAHVTATGKVMKKVIRDCLRGENDRKKVEGWLPRYLAFPFRAYTKAGGAKDGGIRIAAAWDRVKRLLKAA